MQHFEKLCLEMYGAAQVPGIPKSTEQHEGNRQERYRFAFKGERHRYGCAPTREATPSLPAQETRASQSSGSTRQCGWLGALPAPAPAPGRAARDKRRSPAVPRCQKRRGTKKSRQCHAAATASGPEGTALPG